MRPKTIYLILFKFMLISNVLVRSELCTLDNIGRMPNVCDRSNYLVYVSESENGCRTEGTKCWCILLDNRQHQYDGHISLELAQTFNSGGPHPGEVKSYLSFEITSGINRIVVQPHIEEGALTEISSIKIHNEEICKFSYLATEINFDFYQPDISPNPSVDIPDTTEAQLITEQPLELVSTTKQWKENMNNGTPEIITPAPNSQIITKPTLITSIAEVLNVTKELSYVTETDQELDKVTEQYITTTQMTINTDLDIYSDYISEEIQQEDIYPESFIGKCGTKAKLKPTHNSFDGTSAKLGDWPWHAAIYKINPKTFTRNFICGGTLIDQKTVITAAQCVLELKLIVTPEQLTVGLGRHDLLHASIATQEYRVFDIKQHEGFNSDTYENDIAILLLANYVQLTQYVHFICLPAPYDNLQNQVGIAVGWGRDRNNRIRSKLRQEALPVVDNIACLTSNREFFAQFLTNFNFCAGNMNHTICRGDAGGGLVFQSKNKWFLGGIISLTALANSTDVECDTKQHIIVTDVIKYLNWIRRNS